LSGKRFLAPRFMVSDDLISPSEIGHSISAVCLASCLTSPAYAAPQTGTGTMNNQTSAAAVSDKLPLPDTHLDKISGGDILREVVRPRPTTQTYTNGGVAHDDTWNSQT
jgi:hypothetical protein